MNRPIPKDRTYYLKIGRYNAENFLQDARYYRLDFWSFKPFALAETIWQEQEDGTINIVKDRFLGTDREKPLDLKEFFWVKLSAVDYDGSF